MSASTALPLLTSKLHWFAVRRFPRCNTRRATHCVDIEGFILQHNSKCDPQVQSVYCGVQCCMKQCACNACPTALAALDSYMTVWCASCVLCMRQHAGVLGLQASSFKHCELCCTATKNQLGTNYDAIQLQQIIIFVTLTVLGRRQYQFDCFTVFLVVQMCKGTEGQVSGVRHMIAHRHSMAQDLLRTCVHTYMACLHRKTGTDSACTGFCTAAIVWRRCRSYWNHHHHHNNNGNPTWDVASALL